MRTFVWPGIRDYAAAIARLPRALMAYLLVAATCVAAHAQEGPESFTMGTFTSSTLEAVCAQWCASKGYPTSPRTTPSYTYMCLPFTTCACRSGALEPLGYGVQAPACDNSAGTSYIRTYGKGNKHCTTTAQMVALGFGTSRVTCDGFDPKLTCNPVDVVSGGKASSAVDFATSGASKLELQRVYNNLKPDTLLTSLGGGWRFSFEATLQKDTTNSVAFTTGSGRSFYMSRPAGSAVGTKFTPTGEQSDVSAIDIAGTTTAYEVTLDDDTVYHFELDTLSGFYKPTWIKDRAGFKLTLTYTTIDKRAVLQTVADNLGRSLTFTSDANGVLTSIQAPGGITIQYGFDYARTFNAAPVIDSRRLKTVTVTSGTSSETTTYFYEDAAHPYYLTGITDARGIRYATYAYDTYGRVIDETFAGGVEHNTFSYGPTLTTITNALGKQATLNYSTVVGRVRVTGVNGIASAHCVASASAIAYDSTTGRISSTTDEEGRVTAYTRDALGQPLTITRGSGTPQAVTTSYTYHATLHVPTQMVEPGKTTNYTWDAATGRLTSMSRVDTTTTTVPYSTNGQTRTWAYTYTTAAGLLASVDGPLAGTGDTVSYAYDANGFVQTVTNEVGHVTTVNTVNGRGQPTQITDPNGVVSNLTYDFQGRLLTVTVNPGASQAVTTMTYNAVGQVTKVTRPDGSYLSYTYDDSRRLTTVTSNTGETLNYAYDALRNVTSRVIKNGSGTIVFNQTQTFDELGRLLQHIGANTQTTAFSYEKNDNLKTVTDPRSGVYSYAYDSLNRLIQETDQVNAQVNYTLDGQDNTTTYADPRTLQTTYVRNGFGEVIRQSSPDSGITDTVRDLRGLPTQITDGNSVVTQLSYDNAGRLLTKVYPAATGETVTYTYDDITGGNLGKGRLTRITDQTGSTAFVYDARGNVVTETRTISGLVHTVSYVYDLADRVSQITYPSGRIVAYTRDTVGRITGVTTKQNAAAATVNVATGITYQPMSNLVAAFTYGNGLTEADTVSLDYELATLAVKNGATNVISLTHARTDKLNLTGITDAVTAARSQTFAYTAANRLNSATGAYGTSTWTYDGVGNRTGEVSTPVGGSATTRTLGIPAGSNRISNAVIGTTTERAFAYDNAGNITSDTRSGTAYVYAYNKRNRLATVTVGGVLKGTYTYNSLEQTAIRVTTNMTPSGTTHFIYDRAGNLIAETAGGGATGANGTTREYIWLPEAEIAPTFGSRTVVDRPVAVVSGVNATPVTYAVHADHLNRPIKMTDGAKATVWDAVWAPWGNVYAITGTATLDARLPGQWYQLESGLHYNWHRHYDPTLGRYTQPDPLGFVDGPSVYGYAGGSPQVATDLLGFERPGTSLTV